MKEYYSLINKQSFVNAKEEPRALRIWTRVFVDSVSLITDSYKDYELLELFMFKLPWFKPTTTHGLFFDFFAKYALALFAVDPSYIP
jgi:hypothetical protein